jgi:tetratricopeptide (TPR) repeat protein
MKYAYAPKGKKPRGAAATPQLAGLVQAAEQMVQHGNWPQAETLAQQALREAPGHPGALGILGILAVERDDFQVGLQHLQEALGGGYRSSAAYRYAGYAFKQLGEVDRALDAYRKGLELDPRDPALANNMASALMVKAKWKEAAGWAQKSLALQPGFADARLNLGLLDLQAGRFLEGWEGYDARWDLPGFKRPPFKRPLWGGSPSRGKHLLLYPDQGLGDTLMFARYVPLVAAMGLSVHLLVQAELKDLLGTLEGAVSLHTYGEELPEFDLHTSLPSLPRLLKTRVDTIPWPGPYLHAPARIAHREELDRLLAQGEGRKRVGLVWQGNPNHGHDAFRSLPPELLESLAGIPGLAWFGLQVGSAGPMPLEGMADLAPHLGDFADTAHALEHLDLLVSVDTAAAHLAGAMGKPVLLFLHQNSDWRWLLDREDSPWYPGHRLLRQRRYGDWTGPMEQVARLLQD